jgi:hypothetical protein
LKIFFHPLFLQQFDEFGMVEYLLEVNGLAESFLGKGGSEQNGENIPDDDRSCCLFLLFLRRH